MTASGPVVVRPRTGTASCQGCGITHNSADCPRRMVIPSWSLVGCNIVPDNVRAYEIQGR